MPNLNEPMAPNVLDPDPHRAIAGDTRDDDGPALDDYFEAASLGPQSYDSLADPYAKDTIQPKTRLLTRSLSLVSPDGVNTGDPVMLLPADANRLRLLLTVASVGAGNGVRIGDSKSDVYGAPRLNVAATTYDLSGHTGSVWVYNDSVNVADIVTVNVFAVSC